MDVESGMNRLRVRKVRVLMLVLKKSVFLGEYVEESLVGMVGDESMGFVESGSGGKGKGK